MNEPSKSARKREQLELQAMGERLILLEPPELEKVPLDDRLREAVLHARGMKSHGALRRQRQLIGKLMRDADAASIRAALEASQRQDRLARETFRKAELWRDRLAAEGSPALADFAGLAGFTEPKLEKLLRELDASRNEAVRRSIRRRIFREVHTALLAVRDTENR
ncbi:MAG: ribosome biogenesis factor YjgA [Woeseia sp.]